MKILKRSLLRFFTTNGKNVQLNKILSKVSREKLTGDKVKEQKQFDQRTNYGDAFHATNQAISA